MAHSGVLGFKTGEKDIPAWQRALEPEDSDEGIHVGGWPRTGN